MVFTGETRTGDVWVKILVLRFIKLAFWGDLAGWLSVFTLTVCQSARDFMAAAGMEPIVISDEDGTAVTPPTFARVVLESPDLLPIVMLHLDLLALVRSALTCSAMRRAAEALLREEFWVPQDRDTIFLRSSNSDESSLLTFIDVIPSSGAIILSDSSAEEEDKDGLNASPRGGRVLLLGEPVACKSERELKGRVPSRPAHCFEAFIAAEYDSAFMRRRGWAPSGLALSQHGHSVLVVGFRDDGAGSSQVGDVSEWSLSDGTRGDAAAMCLHRLAPAPPLSQRGRGSALDSSGGLTHVFGGLESPLGCAISPASGLVFVVDSDHHRVCVFDPKGFVFAEGAAQPRSGDADAPTVDVYVHAFLYSFGGVEGEWGAAGSGPGELRDPFDVALHEGCAYVTDASNDRISVFREDGTFVRCLPSSCERRGFKGRHRLLKAPSGLDFTPDGRLVVASSTRGDVSIFELELEGAGREGLVLLQRFSLGLGVNDMLCGVCVDAASPCGPRILVVSSRASCVYVLRPASLASAAQLSHHSIGMRRSRSDAIVAKEKDARS